VNDALRLRGEMPINALNTIRNDIVSIQSRWHTLVEEIRIGREKRYRYEDPDFSIFNSPLNDVEIEQLMQSVSLLRRFEGMPGFEWVEEMSAHLQSTVGTSAAPVIGFDENPDLKGMKYFTPLFNAITERKAIKITYHPFDSDEIIDVVHPYYLKEYNQRWFLFGLNDSFKTISNFALDRIESLELTNTKFIENTEIDFAHYFDNVIGVSVKSNKPVEEVRLWVDKEQLPYMLSKPIHKTQRIETKNDDGSAIVAINVVQNFELQQLLLSFGERVNILSPQSLKDEILDRIKKNIDNYK
jgi:predicted DNA-binding transcriptional regulator YafY